MTLGRMDSHKMSPSEKTAEESPPSLYGLASRQLIVNDLFVNPFWQPTCFYTCDKAI
jgi:hypothetical protein